LFDAMYADIGRAAAPWLVPASILAITGLGLGFALAAWVGRRRFHRRNIAGIEEFASYGQAVGHGLVEWLVMLVSAVFLIVGMLAFFVAAGGIIFGRYHAPVSAGSTAAAPVDVLAAKAALKDADPVVYKTLANPDHPKIAVNRGLVSYEWEYLDKRTAASVQVKRIKITLDSDGRIVGVSK
jgi:hypothetical protein